VAEPYQRWPHQVLNSHNRPPCPPILPLILPYLGANEASDCFRARTCGITTLQPSQPTTQGVLRVSSLVNSDSFVARHRLTSQVNPLPAVILPKDLVKNTSGSRSTRRTPNTDCSGSRGLPLININDSEICREDPRLPEPRDSGGYSLALPHFSVYLGR
jgi:hypothetical protein